jgi:hypothetical protein
MTDDHGAARALYKKFLTLYPRGFREQFGESMEQTFSDLYNERKRQTEGRLFGFVLWMFLETAIGIFRERLLLITEGDSMRLIHTNLGSSAFISFLAVLPFMIMELVNRQSFFVSGKESFPIGLFVMLWLGAMVFILILIPIVQNIRAENNVVANLVPTQRNTLLTNPKSAAILSFILVLPLAIIRLLESLNMNGPVERLINGPNPDQLYVPGQLLALVLLSLPVAAGFIARRPIVNTLRAGGSLFAHPVNLIIVVVILASLAWSWGSWVVDQWPCFVGVPNCD